MEGYKVRICTWYETGILQLGTLRRLLSPALPLLVNVNWIKNKIKLVLFGRGRRRTIRDYQWAIWSSVDLTGERGASNLFSFHPYIFTINAKCIKKLEPAYTENRNSLGGSAPTIIVSPTTHTSTKTNFILACVCWVYALRSLPKNWEIFKFFCFSCYSSSWLPHLLAPERVSQDTSQRIPRPSSLALPIKLWLLDSSNPKVRNSPTKAERRRKVKARIVANGRLVVAPRHEQRREGEGEDQGGEREREGKRTRGESTASPECRRASTFVFQSFWIVWSIQWAPTPCARVRAYVILGILMFHLVLKQLSKRLKSSLLVLNQLGSHH